MRTVILKIDPRRPDGHAIAKAASLLRQGGVVAFPTETVYGLGADAFNEAAVREVFAAKGRPADDPLIVHVGSLRDVSKVCSDVPAAAKKLMRTFWPGPLTLVLPKSGNVPGIVTAGLQTICVRMPSNVAARKLCRMVGPIAAPSANTFGRPSPTKAMHVSSDLNGRIPLILDGGSTDIGIESTIVGLSPQRILRPGKITAGQLRKYLPDMEFAVSARRKPLAPGMKYRHYAPRAQLWLIRNPDHRKVSRMIKSQQRKGLKVGLLAVSRYCAADKVAIIGKKPQQAARNCFDALRWLDKQDVGLIIAEGLPETGIGAAVMNRLRRAATKVI
ncbi:threonylcarbamoyl-AMP synthase [Candidatus Woesearchaeota archaeon]|nr:threonylcarbamoyl-AMP synthase [Candidatus Woesearchaeota archaeon]